MKSILCKDDIRVEAAWRADLDEDARRRTQRSDWDYVDTLYNNAVIAASAGLHHIALQKRLCAAEKEANTHAVWDEVARLIAAKAIL